MGSTETLGLKPVRSEDVAKRAGVSRATVSFVLNKRPDVTITPETRDRVLRAAAELNYVPNPAAHALASGKTGMIGVWSSRLYTPYQSLVTKHLHAELLASGYEMLLNDAENRPNSRRMVQSLARWHVDGIVAFGCHAYIRAYMERPAQQRRPMVALDVSAEELGEYADRVDFISMDQYAGVKLAMTHLLRRPGRIAFLTYDAAPEDRALDQRYRYYHEIMAEAGREPEVIVAPWTSPEEARRTVNEYVIRRGPPAGLYCFCDEMAIGAHRGLLDARVRIPEETAVVGHDGVWECDFLSPRLATVGYPLQEACRRICDLLARRLAEPDAPFVNETMPPKLYLRESAAL